MNVAITKTLRLLFTTCILCSLNSQVLVSQTSETQFVINRFGTPLMSEPGIQADTLCMIQPGMKISIIDRLEQSDSVRYAYNRITLVGHWIKTEIDEMSGYVFSADFSSLPPKVELIENGYNEVIYDVDVLWQKTDSSEVTKQVKYGKNMLDYTTNYFSYENGKSEEYWFDGCHFQTYHLNGWKLNEAFHLVRNEISNYGMNFQTGFFLEAPILIRANEFQFVFEMSMSAVDEIIIQYDSDKDITSINFDSCT